MDRPPGQSDGPYAGCPARDHLARLAASWQESQNNTELTEKDKATEGTEKQILWHFAQARDETQCTT
jgi:hypothetical protein